MQTTWILAADASRARIFEFDESQHLREIEGFEHAAGHARNQDLTADAEGRFAGRGGHGQGGAPEPVTDPVQHELERFSMNVSAYLDRAAMQNRYDHLCVFAAPRLLGAMRQHFGDETQRRIDEAVAKDVSKLSPKALEDYLKAHFPH
ncbi:host attachment protein [Chitinivorax sp. PXF-14]|uniref:host attachment protein n=1 Tax=Chitinivorax sp. PXF-14 TaxID=3230488 RepID=UPI003467ED34